MGGQAPGLVELAGGRSRHRSTSGLATSGLATGSNPFQNAGLGAPSSVMVEETCAGVGRQRRQCVYVRFASASAMPMSDTDDAADDVLRAML